MSAERLQKLLSRAGVSSRRAAETLILQGKVSVNGRVVRELGSKADPFKDQIRVEGKKLRFAGRFRYYAFYKPRGAVVSKKDELGRKGIFQMLKLPPAVNAVGRLDKDSEGLLLLTDDGEWLQSYTHPSFGVSKIYRVRISRALSGEEMRQMGSGMILDNKSARVERVKKIREGGGEWVEIELKEGMKREIRRLLEKLGVGVLQLIRVQHGVVKLGSLKPGEIRELRGKPL